LIARDDLGDEAFSVNRIALSGHSCFDDVRKSLEHCLNLFGVYVLLAYDDTTLLAALEGESPIGGARYHIARLKPLATGMREYLAGMENIPTKETRPTHHELPD
jgi:hypothetical protein